MARESFSYRSADGTSLAGYQWPVADDRPVAGAVVLVHGMGEHLGRYDHVADAFAAAGFAVYGHDHRGHGASRVHDAQPGDLGPDGWSALIEDLDLAIARAKAEHPGHPIIVVAHSMGSFATQQFLVDHGTAVDGVALTGTAALDLLEPGLDLSGELDLSAFNLPFQPARTDFDWLTRDDTAVDAYLCDPLCGFGIDIESTKDMFAGARRLADPTQLAQMPHDLPLYLAVGSKDPVNAELALLWPLVDRYRDAGLHDVTVRVYEGARHEIFNETNRADVIADLTNWLQQVSDAPTVHEAQSTTTRTIP